MNQTPEDTNNQTSIEQNQTLTGDHPYVPDKQKREGSVRETTPMLLLGLVFLAAISLMIFGRGLHPNPAANKIAVFQQKTTAAQPTPSAESKIPITEEGHTETEAGSQNRLDSDDVARTATRHNEPVAANLGAIPPFDGQNWQPAAYQQNAQSEQLPENDSEIVEDKNEKDAMSKASLVFVRATQGSAISKMPDNTVLDPGVGLPTGTRLRARIESAVSTSVSTPVIAVIEYNYEKGGEIIVPAGAKAIGHLDAADRTGYVNVRFDSLLMPNGSSIGLEGAATDLELRPVKGKVEGKHAGKNILVRSFAGLGEITATLAGRGSLNQPLSEGDLIRERAADNIAQASDEQIGRLAVTEHIVVTVPANTEIYVVLAKAAKAFAPSAPAGPVASNSPSLNAEQLHQLLQLQKELNQAAASPVSNQ